MKKKILFLITQSNFGGAQKYVFDLATNLDKQKYDVAVAAGPHTSRGEGAGGNGELFTRLEAAGIKVFKLKRLRRPISSIRDTLAYLQIKKLLKEWQPDVLHLNSSKASVLGSLAARNLPIKVIYTVHGAVFEAAFSWVERKLFLWLEKWTAKYKNEIICVSEADRQLWLKYNVAPPEKLITIHNSIDLDIAFFSKEEARQKLFKNLPAPPFAKGGLGGISIVGSIGHLYPEKNYATFIEAVNLITKLPESKKPKNILFAIIGEGQERSLLESLIKKHGLQEKFLLLGAIPEARKYLKAFDVFVLPSVKEGLPYTILEAMAGALPIVASNVGGIPEAVKDGENGFLIQPRDHETLAEKILQILENPELARKFSQNSLERAKEFSLEKMLEQTQAQY